MSDFPTLQLSKPPTGYIFRPGVKYEDKPFQDVEVMGELTLCVRRIDEIDEARLFHHKDFHQQVGQIKNLAGQGHAEWLFRQQEKIPHEWSCYGGLYFPGTKWRKKEGDYVVIPHLSREDDETDEHKRWHLRLTGPFLFHSESLIVCTS